MKCCFRKCEENAVKKVTFDCGPNPDQVLPLCNTHHNFNSSFSRYVKKIEEIKNA